MNRGRCWRALRRGDPRAAGPAAGQRNATGRGEPGLGAAAYVAGRGRGGSAGGHCVRLRSDCAFLCDSAASAIDVGTELVGAGVCRTVRVASGPVPGARVVPAPVSLVTDPPKLSPPIRYVPAIHEFGSYLREA